MDITARRVSSQNEGKYMQKFTVRREDWYRGKGDRESRLMRPEDHKMCCLGFYALANGYKPGEIENRCFPSDLTMGENEPLPDTMDWLLDMYPDTEQEYELLIGNINDDPDSSEQERERDLTRMFAKHGVQVEFV